MSLDEPYNIFVHHWTSHHKCVGNLNASLSLFGGRFCSVIVIAKMHRTEQYQFVLCFSCYYRTLFIFSHASMQSTFLFVSSNFFFSFALEVPHALIFSRTHAKFCSDALHYVRKYFWLAPRRNRYSHI